MDKNKVKEMLENIKSVKELINELIKEENNLMNEMGTPNYKLEEVITENVIDKKVIDFRQFVLKSESGNSFIKSSELEEGKFLHSELKQLITEFLGEDYVNVSFIRPDDRNRFYDESEFFGIVFKKAFSKTKHGTIRAFDVDKCDKYSKTGITAQIDENKCQISIDQVRSKCLFYKGHNIAANNILFFGYNIEENPFLVELFQEQKPAKILNIVPIGDMKPFYDNVD